MSKAIATSPITLLTPHAASAEISKLIPRTSFQGLAFWGQLERTDQDTLLYESNMVSAAFLMEGISTLVAGQHLKNVYDLLKDIPRAFKQVCKLYKKPMRTAYRYMSKFADVEENLPEPVIRAAMARGIDLANGRYVTAVKRLPPPMALSKKVIDPKVANKYLDNLMEVKSKISKKTSTATGAHNKLKQAAAQKARLDPNTQLMQMYRMGRNIMAKMSPARKRHFLEAHVGTMLTEAGIQFTTKFRPEPIPEEFKARPGRPRLVGEDD